MNNEEILFTEINKFRDAAQKNINDTAEKWLNIAYKLDYISLSFKDKIDLLLRKKTETELFNVHYAISDEDISDILTITEIASNTKFSELQLKSIAC